MKRSDVDYLYEWATRTDFPLRRAPTAVGYSNKDIHFCWLKAIYRNGAIGGVRKSVVADERAQQILDQEEVIFATVSVFDAGTKLIAARPIVEPDGIPIDEYIGNTLPTGLVDFSTTLDGISGFDIGNAVHNKFVLPMRYRAKTIFSVTSIEHTITPGDWSTSLEAFMRLISL